MSLTLTNFEPRTSSSYAGKPVIVQFNYVIENSYWHNFMPWQVWIELKLDGKIGNRYDKALGRFAYRDLAEIQLTGVMPTHDLAGQFIIYAAGAFHVKPEELDRVNVRIRSLTPGPPVDSYPCPYCHLEFPTLGQLDAHIRDVHDIEPPAPPPPPDPGYECPYCDAAFYTQAGLDAHIKAWHPVVPPPPPPEPPNGPPPPDEVDWLKWGLIAGGIALVSVVLLSKRR